MTTSYTAAAQEMLGGFVERAGKSFLTVRTTNETVVITKTDIETRKATGQSLMPEGLFDKLKPDEVRDLVAYLGTPHQVPLPPKK